jgi:alpha-L-arabinofuranosidase
VQFSVDEWYELLNEADRMDGLITGHWGVMGETDRRRRVKLVVDEWGAWYKPGTAVAATHLFGQQLTLRDALITALTLDTFHRHADKVVMANVAQLINCLHSLFLAHDDQFVTTPAFHVFEQYAAHVGGQSVRTVFSAPRIGYQRVNDAGSFWGLGGSATLKDRVLTLTVVNPHVTEPRDAEIAIRGAAPGAAAKGVTITAPDIHAHNTFAEPHAVQPREVTVTAPREGVIAHRFPPASVTRLTFNIT